MKPKHPQPIVVDLDGEEEQATIPPNSPAQDSTVANSKSWVKDHEPPTTQSIESDPVDNPKHVSRPSRSSVSPSRSTSPTVPTPALTPAEQRALAHPIKILIHSRIPSTDPLIVTVKLGQRLKDVHVAWVSRQSLLTPEQKAEVYLSWRGKKIYPFTTCANLGIQVNELGEVWWRGAAMEPAVENSQIVFEAVTSEIVERDRKAEEEKQRKDAGLARSDGGTGDAADKAGDDTLKIIVRGKGYKEYKLKVRLVSFHTKHPVTFRPAYVNRSIRNSSRLWPLSAPLMRLTRARRSTSCLMVRNWILIAQ